MNNRLIERVVDRHTVYRGAIFDVERLDVRLPNGAPAIRDVVRHRGAAAVLPIDEDGNVSLVHQYRVAVDRIMLEIPAGKLDKPGEDPLDCAHRELLEETGLRAGAMRWLTAIDTTVGFTDERIHIYLATDLTRHEACPDEDEFVQVETMPLRELVRRAHAGEIADPKTIIASLLTAQILPQYA